MQAKEDRKALLLRLFNDSTPLVNQYGHGQRPLRGEANTRDDSTLQTENQGKLSDFTSQSAKQQALQGARREERMNTSSPESEEVTKEKAIDSSEVLDAGGGREMQEGSS
ncbi:MAG: hypothetical protein Q9227_005642 [Pyrenula ochraceoflavens]